MTSREIACEEGHVKGIPDEAPREVIVELAWAVKSALGPQRRSYIVMSHEDALLVDQLDGGQYI
jgi:hypothetical protein